METLDEFNTTSTAKIPKDGWLVNLRISGSISTNEVEKQYHGTWDPMDTEGARRKYTRYLNKGPP